MILRAARLVTAAGERRDAWLHVEDGLINGRERIPGEPVEELDGVVLPGFVDGHAHGALGVDFASCTLDEARAVAAYHLTAGTTDLVASIATAPLPVLEERLALLSSLVTEGVLAGLHLEGPYLAPERRGAHDAALLRLPDRAEAERLIEAAGGALVQVTIAPELPGALAVIRLLTERGIRVAIGHTACSAAVARQALEAGASGFTHLFNGMPPMAGRSPGPVGAALASSAHLEVIGDGRHLAEETIELVLRLAPGRTALVSDAMAATGLGDGAYRLAGSAVTVAGGVARTAAGSLAGSTMTLGDAVVRRAGAHGVSPRLAAVSSGAAARFLGLRRDLEVGSPANLVQLTPEADGGFAVARVLRHGRWISAGGPSA